MAIKTYSLRIEEAMLEKLSYISDFEGRSVNSQILVLVRESIERYEEKYGAIDGSVEPVQNVKLGRAGEPDS